MESNLKYEDLQNKYKNLYNEYCLLKDQDKYKVAQRFSLEILK